MRPRTGHAASLRQRPIDENWKRCGILVILVAAVFSQTVGFDFVNIDDNAYVTENAAVAAGLSMDSVVWAFTSTALVGFWQPLVWLSLMLDRVLYGDWAGGFHLTNVLLHLMNSLVLFHWLRQLTGARDRSFLVAAFFAVHPLHVESVAWVTERKDVLSTLLGLLCLLSWLNFRRGRGRRWYVFALLSLIGSLSAKQMLVTLPAVMLLLDYWSATDARLRKSAVSGERAGSDAALRFGPDLIPFLMVSLVFSWLAWSAQSGFGATRLLSDVTLPDRIANAAIAYVAYLRMAVWPFGLSVFYPHPGQALSAAQISVSLVVLLSITAGCLAVRGRSPSLLVGWLWYLGTLVPVIGIIQVGYQQLADRFMYFPLIGLLIGVIWAVPDRAGWRKCGRVFSSALLACCVVISFQQTRHWQDSTSLCKHGLRVTRDNWFLHATLGAAIMKHPELANETQMDTRLRLQQAERHLQEAISLRPDFVTAYFNLGLVLGDLGRFDDAIAALRMALHLEPRHAKARFFLQEVQRRRRE